MPMSKSKHNYVINNKIIMERWDYNENNKLNLNPKAITQGSHIKANFICPDCHNKWYGEIRYVIRYNGGCPVCASKKRVHSRNETLIKKSMTIFEYNPELEKEWDYNKNSKIGLNPEKISYSSNKKAFWICNLGHPYDSIIGNRTTKGTGCPICANQQLLEGFNDLATTRPDLLSEWDYELNDKINLFPNQVMKGSHKVANWICPLGHKYKKEIHIRTGGHGCSVCSIGSQTSFPEQAIYFYLKNNFQNVENRYGKPEIDIYINDINFGIEYDGSYAHRNKSESEKKKDKIISSKGIYLLRIKETDKLRDDNDKTIYCKPNSNNTYLNDVIIKIINIINKKYNLNKKIDVDIKRDRIKIEEQYIINKIENSITNLYPDIALEWDYELNGNLKPEFISWGSKKKYWWKCNKGHSYESSPYDRVKGYNCIICYGRKLIKGVNDLKTKCPHLIKYWDYNKNADLPDLIKFTRPEKYWWKCDKGHSYQATIKTMRKYNECIACKTNNKEPIDYAIRYGLIKGVNDFKTINPEMAEEWDYDKNNLLPEDSLYSSNKEVWWKCKKCGCSWLSNMNQRKNCPECKKRNMTYNIYSIDTGELIGIFVGLRAICKFLNLEYNKQRGNICSVARRNQKTIENKYVIRKATDDEFDKLSLSERIIKIQNFINNKHNL